MTRLQPIQSDFSSSNALHIMPSSLHVHASDAQKGSLASCSTSDLSPAVASVASTRTVTDSTLAPSPLPSPSTMKSCLSPWLLHLMYPLGHRVILPGYFSQITVSGQEHLYSSTPLILAPTHRSRWDALIVPYAAGKLVTGKHLRFMVSADEMLGVQGWFIRRLGGFPVDTRKPGISSLRYAIELLHRRENLVIFPEGNIHHGQPVQRLKPGLARLALQAESLQPGLGIGIVPISIRYAAPLVPWRTRVRVTIGAQLPIAPYTQGNSKQQAVQLTHDLELALKGLHDSSDSLLEAD